MVIIGNHSCKSRCWYCRRDTCKVYELDYNINNPKIKNNMNIIKDFNESNIFLKKSKARIDILESGVNSVSNAVEFRTSVPIKSLKDSKIICNFCKQMCNNKKCLNIHQNYVCPKTKLCSICNKKIYARHVCLNDDKWCNNCKNLRKNSLQMYSPIYFLIMRHMYHKMYMFLIL